MNNYIDLMDIGNRIKMKMCFSRCDAREIYF